MSGLVDEFDELGVALRVILEQLHHLLVGEVGGVDNHGRYVDEGAALVRALEEQEVSDEGEREATAMERLLQEHEARLTWHPPYELQVSSDGVGSGRSYHR